MKISYYSQTGDSLDEMQTVLKFVWNSYPKLTLTEVRKALARFLFKGDDVEKEIKVLSGGEKARLELLMIMLSESNFLILDEPTNHLDIYSREALENALLDYEGTLFIVSHDRYFINKLATKIYKISKDGAKLYKGNYDYYIENSEKDFKAENEKVRNTSYKERKEQEALARKKENQIKRLESEIAELENQIKEKEEVVMSEEYATDYIKALEITNEIEKLKEELNNKYNEWSNLLS